MVSVVQVTETSQPPGVYAFAFQALFVLCWIDDECHQATRLAG